MRKFKVGIIGCGQRGVWWIEEILVTMPYVEITAVCDLYEDRMDRAAEVLKGKLGAKVELRTTDYRELIDSDMVDTVLVFSGWENHVPATLYAMKKGKPIGLEVGGAYDIQQCYDLVRTYEETGTPVMLLENCCYGEVEMTVTNMVRKGLFGTIVHCEGGYCHEMRDALAGINRDRHYRGEEYRRRNCESYPTHEIGPIAKLLNIGNGNRFVSLVSMASKSASMNEYLAEKAHPLKDTPYVQGDIFKTMLKCAGGETVTITLDTTLPRYYSRDFTVRGTKGMYEERNNSVYLDGCGRHWNWKPEWDNMTRYMEEYRPALWEHYNKVYGGQDSVHGSMDHMVMAAFFDALDKGLPMPIDVYDAACWMAITALSEQSVALGSAPVAFPDFTGGRWKHQKPSTKSLFDLR